MIVEITDDFDLQRIADSGQCFRVKPFPDGSWRFITGRHLLYMRHLEGPSWHVSCTEEEWQTLWQTYFDLDRSYRSVRSQIPASDSFLKKAADGSAGLRILRQNPWEMIVTFIISQQRTIPSIKSTVERIAEAYGEVLETDREQIHMFPSAGQMARASMDELNSFKLGYRSSYILDAVKKVNSGQLDLAQIAGLDDSQLFDTLKSIRGVGDKVASCIALFAYGRTSLAPVDTWIKKVIDHEYQGKSPFPAYGSTAGIMQQYMFYYARERRGRL